MGPSCVFSLSYLCSAAACMRSRLAIDANPTVRFEYFYIELIRGAGQCHVFRNLLERDAWRFVS